MVGFSSFDTRFNTAVMPRDRSTGIALYTVILLMNILGYTSRRLCSSNSLLFGGIVLILYFIVKKYRRMKERVDKWLVGPI